MRTTLLFLHLLACLACLAACAASQSAPSAAAYATPAPAEPPGAPLAVVDHDALADTGDLLRLGEIGGEREEGKAEQPGLAKKAPPGAAGQGAPAGGQAPAADQGEVAAARSPLLIYTANITMAVFEVVASLNKVEAIARELGGFLAKRDDTAIVIRVPVARFDEAVRRIEDVGDMLHRNVAVQDVTEEYLDLEIRLKNARAVRDRLEKLLEKAASVEESVLLERELGRVAGEIERLEGRLKFLRDRAAFSTLSVTFQPRPRETLNPTGARLPVSWLEELGLGRLLNL